MLQQERGILAWGQAMHLENNLEEQTPGKGSYLCVEGSSEFSSYGAE
jgi:hypothetical protein